jgi:hypothetical protein
MKPNLWGFFFALVNGTTGVLPRKFGSQQQKTTEMQLSLVYSLSIKNMLQ